MDVKKFGNAVLLIGFCLALVAIFFWAKVPQLEDDLSSAKADDALAAVYGRIGYEGRTASENLQQALDYRNYFGVASVLVLMLGAGVRASAESSKQGVKKCPHCAESIQTEAKICRYCQRDVAPAEG